MLSPTRRIQALIARVFTFVSFVLLLASPAVAVECANHDVDYPPVLGTLPQAPLVQWTLGLAVEGNYAYISEQYLDIGGYAQLSVVDVSNPASPMRRGTSGPLGGFSDETVVSYRQFVYGMTAGISQISVVNASNPQNPIVVGHFGGIVGDYDLAIRPESFPNANDARLCFIGVNFRLYGIPGFPSLIGTLALAGDRVNAAGDYAYVSSAAQDALFVIDIVGPNTPALVATVPFPVSIGEIGDQAIDGDHLYVSADGFVHVFDLTVPVAPAYLNGVETFSGGSLAAAGDRTFVDIDYGTTVVSSGGPGLPALVGTFPTLGGQQIAIAGDRLYRVDRWAGLSIIDVSNPLVAPLLGGLNLPRGAESVAINGAVACINTYDTFATIDISDPAVPASLGSVGGILSAWDVALGGNHAFVACYDTLNVVDISDPSTPQIVGKASAPMDFPTIAVSGNVACVAAETAGLLIFDISTPSAPILLRTLPPISRFTDVAAAGDHAYVIDTVGLHVVDLSPPELADIIATVPVDGYEGVTARNGLVYVSDDDGMAIIDVADPTLPSILGRVALPWYPRDISVDDEFAYVTTGRLIHVIDISTPTAPVLIGGSSTPSPIHNVAVTDGFVVAAGSDFFTLPLQCPASAGVGTISAPPQVGWLRAFPNPTHGLTTIEVATQGPHAELRIYDLAGRLVRSLPAGSTGTHSISWDGRDARGRAVAGGAYWLRLEDGAAVHTTKVTVLR